MEILSQGEHQTGFDEIVRDFNLKSSLLPPILEPIKEDIQKYLAFFVNPESVEFSHLQIFGAILQVAPSRNTFEIALTQIKWLLKLNLK